MFCYLDAAGCGRPLTVVRESRHSDRDDTAILGFKLSCPCGWTGELAGLVAVHHWVEPWDEVIEASAGG
jgi:hypothetical protein